MKITRRAFLGAGAAVSGSLLLPGCLNGGGGPLRVAWYGGAPVHEGMRTALQAWAQGSGEEYAPEQAAFADYWDKLATQAAGGQAPDVFRMSMSYFRDYADRGALLDLTEMAGGAIRTGDLDPDVASSGDVEGSVYGIGQSSISQAFFVDAASLDEVGVELDPDWTWAGFEEFARGFAGEVGAGRWGSSDMGGGLQMFEVFARQRGTDVFADDGSGLATSTETVEEWFALWDGLRRDDAVPPADVSGESDTFETSLLVAGTAPVGSGWVQQVTFYQPLVTDTEIRVVPVPAAESPGDLSGQFLKALDLWCVSGETGDPEAAASVVDFLVNDPAATRALGLSLGVPPSQAGRDALAADADAAQQRAIDYVDDITDRVGPAPGPWPAGYGELLTTFTRLNEDIAFGRSDPAAAATAYAEEAGRVLGS